MTPFLKKSLTWLPLACFDMAFSLFAMVFCSWWLPAFANARGWLPRRLSWFQTFDASLDWGWQGGTFPPSFSQHWDRCKWLFRNPAYGLGYGPLGIPFDPSDWTVHRVVRTPAKQFFFASSRHGHFNLYYHGPLGMYKLGWKAWNYWDIETLDWKPGYQWGPEMRTAIAASFSPFKRRKSV